MAVWIQKQNHSGQEPIKKLNKNTGFLQQAKLIFDLAPEKRILP